MTCINSLAVYAGFFMCSNPYCHLSEQFPYFPKTAKQRLSIRKTVKPAVFSMTFTGYTAAAVGLFFAATALALHGFCVVIEYEVEV